MPDNLTSIIMLGLMLLVSLLAFGRWVLKKFAPVKTVQAKVVDKHIIKLAYSKTGTYGKKERHCVVFQVEGKKLSFYVNEFSYNGYRKGETGRLTYKGDRIIDFQ